MCVVKYALLAYANTICKYGVIREIYFKVWSHETRYDATAQHIKSYTFSEKEKF